MKRMIALLTTGLIALPASAHWQWTKWGMSPTQLIAASKGTASKVDPSLDVTAPYGVKEAVGTFNSSGRPLKASYWFKGGGLSQIDLSSSSEDDCFSLRRDLNALYGQPLSRSSMSTVWTDRPKGNRIQFVDWGPQGCNLIYSPIPSSANTGL